MNFSRNELIPKQLFINPESLAAIGSSLVNNWEKLSKVG